MFEIFGKKSLVRLRRKLLKTVECEMAVPLLWCEIDIDATKKYGFFSHIITLLSHFERRQWEMGQGIPECKDE